MEIPNNLPSRETVLGTVFKHWRPEPSIEEVLVDDAAGRILAEDQFSDVTIPVVRASGCDGVALKSSMFQEGYPDFGKMILGTDFARADTGDDFPDAFDAVIAIENVEIADGKLLSMKPGLSVGPNTNVRQKGTTVSEGELLALRGTRLKPTDLAALAAGGKVHIPVYKKIRVAFLPTGTELVPVGTVPKRGQIIDSNSVLMKHGLRDAGCEPIMYPITRDNVSELKVNFESALMQDTDIIIINGGSSKGEEDFNAKMLAEKGTLLFHGVGIVPGRPMAISIVNGKLAIVLPGPALAAFNGLEWFLKPAIAHMYHIPVLCGERIKGILTDDLRGPKPMEFLCKVNVFFEDGQCRIEPLNGHGSTMPRIFRANAMLYLVPGTDTLHAGDEVEVKLLCDLAEIPGRR